MRCERCRTSDLTLVSFGVYQCPVCGTVDADGNLLQSDHTEPAARADETQPNVHAVVEAGRSSFAAPPPISPIAAALAAQPSSTASAPIGTHELPKLFLATVVVLSMLDLVGAAQSRNIIALVLGLGTNAALITGKRWARTLAIGGAVLAIGLCAMAFVVVHGRGPYGIASGVGIVAYGWWLYVLLRPDTVAYFSR